MNTMFIHVNRPHLYMKKLSVPLIMLILLCADPYFYQVVQTLTSNLFILYGYWLVDLLLIAGLIYVMVMRRPNNSLSSLISGLMGLFLLSFVPKAFAMPVLLLEDLTRLFHGFPLTQLSDIHSGSFTSQNGIEKGINMVNAQSSDLILFTGDLVNNEA